ncbi:MULTISPECIES: SCO4225 family membrane protein [unclassified Streptomyces]|uniref:SCO4225 family membrane protein n=1 Tax=unclassified Streptomyces TaxID=2593676 RepID=UPI00278C1657|nr:MULTISPECIES: hypothetical protein [unclassified Streptomyces]
MNARTVLRLTVTNPASALYLAAVTASVAFTAAVTLFSSDPGFAGVWPFLPTAPTSLFTVAALDAAWGTEAPIWALTTAIAASALLQSLALGATLDALRGRRHVRPTS